ncbi:MAG TPA: PEP-CTERM sorting domain-containing protein [Verrucomicrobiae bacterium]|jgi:hypothetical protein
MAGLTSAALPANAAFHLWTIREIYSDSSGSLQFIELFCGSGGQTFIGGQQISVTSGGSSKNFTIPSNLGSDTLNHALLFGTAGIHAAGAPTPDFTIPSNFLTPGGNGSISFFGLNSGSYTTLPNDGTHSLTWGTSTTAINSPQNFAGTVGQITPVPEPATWGLFALGGAAFLLLFRKRG